MGALTSRLRRRLLDATRRIQAEIERLVRERGPLMRGTFGIRARRCGGANCRCTRGELHESKYVAASDGGRLRQVHVPVHEEAEVEAATTRYRGFGQVRGRLKELHQHQLDLVDKLGLSLLKPYPPGRPLPPPRRRGRRPGGGGHGRR